MGDRGRFSGAACHIEYHTVNPKKEKAANCIYLDTGRICRCKASPWYLAKCFDATGCTYRKREEKTKLVEEKRRSHTTVQKERRMIPCAIPKGAVVVHKTLGEGKVQSYDKKQGLITVKFASKTTRFQYPYALEKGFLLLKGK